MITLFGALIVATVAAPFLIRYMGRPAFGLLAIVPGVGFFWTLTQFTNGAFDNDFAYTARIEWMPNANLAISLRMDALAAQFSLIILGIGALVLAYCWGYFDKTPRRLAIFGAQMVGFATAMYGLVLSDNFLLMYVFWEITSLLSFLLVSYYGERASSRRSAQQALMVTVLGGLSMLVGIVVLGRQTGAWSFTVIAEVDNIVHVPYVTVAIVLILVGALTKSAIAPAHFWLPGAMAAPTPVSAYLHSAAMVKAGIYLVARLAPEFHEVATWHLVVLPLGLFTMLLGGWMALKQKDLKLVLAYGTVSQLGFITTVMAIGSREAMQAGLALTFAHSLFKAALFMVVGAIDHTSGTRDIDKLSGLGRKQPVLFIIATISALSMAGIPPLFGFVSKESVLETLLEEELLVGMPRNIILVGVVAGSILTMTYTLRFLWGAFATKDRTVSEAVENMHPMGGMLWIPPAILTALTVLFGIWPDPLSSAVNQHLDNIFGTDEETYLALWHGFTVALGLSAIIIVAGIILHWQRQVLHTWQFTYPALGSADDAYDTVINSLRTVSLHLTASTQRGSLQFNLTVIFGTLILLPVISLISGDLTNVRMIVAENPWQIGAALVIVMAATAATVINNRLSAVIVVGITGYALAFIFALHGAPDLALTQLLVETIVMVIFMLVLRKMPASVEWKQDPKMGRLRAWLSVGVGLAVTLVALFAINARSARPISETMPELAKEIGHGSNAVNVLLVDMRAWDTFGETTVLIIAAIGLASLIFRTQSFARPSRRPTLRVTGRRWLAAGVETEQQLNRSLMIDVATRVLFPSMMALSLFFFFAGHNAPGGGFAGGLVAALALTLRYLAGGWAELEEALPIDGGRIMGAGLLISLVAIVAPMFFGLPPLASAYTSVDIPLIGSMSLPSALVFDTGVYLIVVGLALYILNSLGSKLDHEEEMRKQRARDRARSLARRQRQRSAAQKSGAKKTPARAAARAVSDPPPAKQAESAEPAETSESKPAEPQSPGKER
ncbi:Multisubunit sodium/proton antiporter subunit [Corynebacterium camporealensis]|uniref:Multisubunit sodium/proton antiporter subunit n=1 Tax=Corynebacterium camporealensis TaxID=161896 RepID=A0A0F6TC12_9CORY|nr:Na+/H+ antiporter subunit A [Corynebacterium camporealensis]AKE39971.1 multisubunit sodium/proton antiporter subunit [Corynebacterium camporealensis]AVH89064.1 Multisubunit sodium/proton antiporter subunit [Corynebacterium camporealensis]